MRPDDPTPPRGMPMPRPPAPRAPPVVYYVPMMPAPAQRRRRTNDNRAVGTLIFLVLVAVLAIYLYPTIRDAMRRDSIRRSIAGVPGVVSVVDLREAKTPQGGTAIVVSMHVHATAFSPETAERAQQRTATAVDNLDSFMALLSDGERVYSYGWDADTRAWGIADMTGIVETF